jgi:hypothetical protein
MTDHLIRAFNPKESNFPYIIPALKNGQTVLVTVQIAREFRLADPALIVGGKTHYISFKKREMGLWEMRLATL